MNHPRLEHLVGVQSFASPKNMSIDPINRLEDVRQPLAIVPHQSNGSRLAHHAVADTGLQARFRDHINTPAEEILQVHLKPPEVQEASPARHRNQEVEVTPVVRLPADHRSEDPDVECTVLGRQAKDLIAFLAKERLESFCHCGHAILSPWVHAEHQPMHEG